LRLSTIIGGVLSRSSRACFASRSNAAFAPAALAGLAPMSRRHMSLKDMDQATVAKIQDTWKVVEKDMDNHAVKFYETMLEMSPEIRQLFVNRNEYGYFPEDSMMGLKRHSIDVMVMIGHAVAGLNDVKSIEKELRELAERHAKYGVESEHFPLMGKALLLTLERELGSKWTPEVKAAWDSAYESVSEIMLPELAKEHEALAKYKEADYMRPEKPHA